MTSRELRQKYLDFFKEKEHAIIPSAPVVPENDPTVLFTTAGMHPLVPFLMGEKHPKGKRLANVQKCVRTVDIDEVGDNRHLTFFEMLGNWSLGDYFKREAIEWSFEFITSEKWLGLDPRRLYVTVFEGDEDAVRDEESIRIWQEQFAKVGIKAEAAGEDRIVNYEKRIIPLGKDDNWWGPAGKTGPCGPCTEMFYDVSPELGKVNDTFGSLVKNFRLMEIWNDVFMEFNKKADATFEKMKQQNVDTGMGLERTLVVLTGKDNVFDTEFFQPIIRRIEELSAKNYSEDESKISMRIVSDHLKAATFMIADGVLPSNVERGYVLRRLIRRAVRQGKILGIEGNFTSKIAEVVISEYKEVYPELGRETEKIIEALNQEEMKFRQTLEKGLKKIKEIIAESRSAEKISGEKAFHLFSTYGFPLELTKEIAREHGIAVDEESYHEHFKKHQELSRTVSAGMFKGGLADAGESAARLHTATHLLLAALRKVLGDHVIQKGSNITGERLRLDFSHEKKMTPEEIQKTEGLVNEAISKDIPVKCEEMTLEDAQKMGAMGVFGEKYGDKVKVYSIFDFSSEICGGPHADATGALGNFRIKKEEASSAGVRRIKAVLE
ncbi:MAG: alanyl-tRNA synthetase, alanyl-tRNA synthetase [Candidatus Moranbacteria bacterium GW2011_GWC1_45_18]|nr:MAG: Alanine-tRNA ligase [Candidatus Moranbacteria bacterium GW2011_GWC2_40_12]KKT32802.1 MAG: Alanine-tRNA ligase [Candidatus Moranbacteria bacterium GW2011_GWF2_44_10]KKT99867.1 MAG: alanyl-tRNA synthetase, alanyl-tRNA synthetase [Candidatus Moranbacteria bacterium GW2011_GWC1_45_18]OGI22559.1 MAG: alanine--tRNA ligase [Candidatus Moranbacteria bacterium RIFOXYA1_FULL_44_8]OGI34424.1 MAG: alanine--tRNA ligase [Candidatus Moranbacteria bacterium RIFOXYC1_FULL_44_8]OGI40793.1 MAG: alanine--